MANPDPHKTTVELLGAGVSGKASLSPQVSQGSVTDHVKNLEVLSQGIADMNAVGKHFFEFSYGEVSVTILLEIDQNHDRRLSTVQSNGQSLAKIPGLRPLLESFEIPVKDVSFEIATANIKSGAMFAQAPRAIPGQEERKNILLQKAGVSHSSTPTFR